MLSTSLAVHPWLATALLVAAVVLGPLVAWALADRRRTARGLAGLAIVAVGVLTLWPSRRDPVVGCDLGWHPALLAPEPLANVVLLVPVGVLLAVALRRLLVAALVGVLLPVALEAIQLAVPALGRSCALDDWTANAVGALLGVALGALGLAIARRRRRSDAASDA